MKEKILFNTKIIFALFISFVVVKVISSSVFLPNTPRINPSFLAQLFSPKSQFDRLNNIPLNEMVPLAPGVFAKEDEELKTVYIRLPKNDSWDKRTFVVNGKRVMLVAPN